MLPPDSASCLADGSCCLRGEQENAEDGKVSRRTTRRTRPSTLAPESPHRGGNGSEAPVAVGWLPEPLGLGCFSGSLLLRNKMPQTSQTPRGKHIIPRPLSLISGRRGLGWITASEVPGDECRVKGCKRWATAWTSYQCGPKYSFKVGLH